MAMTVAMGENLRRGGGGEWRRRRAAGIGGRNNRTGEGGGRGRGYFCYSISGVAHHQVPGVQACWGGNSGGSPHTVLRMYRTQYSRVRYGREDKLQYSISEWAPQWITVVRYEG